AEESLKTPRPYPRRMTHSSPPQPLKPPGERTSIYFWDSSKGSAEHPHTLMLLNQGKIYNIKIRRQGNSYLLGNGFNRTQRFPGVTEAIIHYTNTPLVLIDAAAQSSAEKPQCCLLHPAGL
uniref:SH2 domain-containing protein n=1 Tax=Kryptolebias marmoratus TaxID=37003 RepID=A0A3Q3A9F6_KRYMA